MSIESLGASSCSCTGDEPIWGDDDTPQVDTATKVHLVLGNFLRSEGLRFDKRTDNRALLQKSIGPWTWLEHIWDAEMEPPQMPETSTLPPGWA